MSATNTNTNTNTTYTDATQTNATQTNATQTNATQTNATQTNDMTLDDVRSVLVKAVAAEAGIAPAELATDQPFTAYGLDSMAALSVGMEIEDNLGLTDPPVDLLWDHPTVDTLAEALWKLMTPMNATNADGQR